MSQHSSTSISTDKLVAAYKTMRTARSMSDLFEEHAKLTSKYVHACSNGHEAIQVAAGSMLKSQDWLSCYYRDDSMLLSMGLKPEELILQLFAKRDDPFSGGRTYYCHPSLNRPDLPKIPHQSSATGMQAIPAAGVAMGLQYREQQRLDKWDKGEAPVVMCSLGDAAITEGEVSEALYMTALKKLPMIWLVQDNEWDISAHASEIRFGDATTMAAGFPPIEVRKVDGTDLPACLALMQEVFDIVREERRPFLIHATVPLLGHHTSGVRKEFYRDDLEEASARDPLPRIENYLLDGEILDSTSLALLKAEIENGVVESFEKARNAEEPIFTELLEHIYAPTPITEEKGTREPKDGETTLMVDCALHAIQEIMTEYPESLLYGQDVGKRLGGVFRETATLGNKFGDDRVFNTPIQEAFIIGSTVGMSCVGLKPIVEVQFADYLWPGLNQLFSELSRSYFLSNGKWPVHSLIRVPIGAYGSGGPYHSSSIESVLANIRGIKVAYPSNGADLKGLLKSAFHDPNPVVVLEHKGLYWSKIPGTEAAKCIEPSEDYIIPFGKARTVISATDTENPCCSIITYGRGVYWAIEAAKEYPGVVEIIDLRTIVPIDFEAISSSIKRTNRCLILSEESISNSFAQALCGRVAKECFEHLDAAPQTLGSVELPAIPLNEAMEQEVLPNAKKVAAVIGTLLDY
ncbi:MAG TPA: tungsten formylmethanofuran dehydrogenase [Flavobacteriales bacterium]|nr:tungsten formylmethanofuran dehydrogenase [Flavobacteriales bacterium]